MNFLTKSDVKNAWSILAKRAFLDNALLLSILINQAILKFAKKATMIKYVFLLFPILSFGQVRVGFDREPQSSDFGWFNVQVFENSDTSCDAFSISVRSKFEFDFCFNNEFLLAYALPSDSTFNMSLSCSRINYVSIQQSLIDSTLAYCFNENLVDDSRPMFGYRFIARYSDAFFGQPLIFIKPQ